jgi:carboxypeptidase Taq
VSPGDESYSRLVLELSKLALFGSCASVLGWDEQTYLPPRGGEHRANQLGLLAGLRHQMATAPALGELIEAAGEDLPADPDDPRRVVVAEALREFDRATKLPQSLVEELTRATSLGQQAWVKARQKKEFSEFLPWLDKIIQLKRQEAAALGFGDGVPYDALLDGYEPGAKTAEVDAVFTAFRDPLVALLRAIVDSPNQADPSILERSYPVDRQAAFSRQAAAAIGFDFEAGRLDIAAHPFCSGFGPGDCRLTTRYDEHHFPGAFFGTLHEAGHGLYEQGLPVEHYGTALGEAASLGIHESQSRMWENFVGRSRSFWDHFYPQARATFPEALSDVQLDAFHRAVNDVRPTLIRVEADEVTYNLHIMLRFELEQLLIHGDLDAIDVPAAWNERMESYLGIVPPDDSLGCMQDVHWSAGLFGYFPTYALGNMHAAQLYRQAEHDLGELAPRFARGEFEPLGAWLQENVHRHGRRFLANRLVERVTGSPLSHEPLMEHLQAKYGELYGL